MEAAWLLAGLMLASGTGILRAGPVAPNCTLELVKGNQDIKVFYTTSKVTSGCTSRGPADLDVHVLYLNTSKLLQVPLSLNVTAAARNRKTVLVLDSAAYTLWKITTEGHSLPLSFVVGYGHVEGTHAEINSTQRTSSSRDDLLTWAKATYGGVTSFTELESPESINFHVGNVNSSNQDCIPERDFNARQYLEASFASHNIRSCSASGGRHQKEAHILWLKQAPPESGTQEVDVNIKVTCREENPATHSPMLLVLKSHNSILWNFGQMPNLVSLVVSGKYAIKMFKSSEIQGESLPDSEEGLIQAAHGKNFAFIASYTEIPAATSLTVELHRVCGGPMEETTPKPQTEVSSPPSVIQMLVTMCKPWSCTDNTLDITLSKSYLERSERCREQSETGRMEALRGVPKISEITLQDPSCKATDNSTHFVLRSLLESCSTAMEGGVLAKNKLVLSLTSPPEKVTSNKEVGGLPGNSHRDRRGEVPFECILPEKSFLQLYHTSDFSASPTTVIETNKATYVQISLRTADKEAKIKVDDCSLHTPHQTSPQFLISSGKPQSYAVKFLPPPTDTIHRFSFVYKSGGETASTVPATLVCKVQVNSESKGTHEHESVLEVMLKNPHIPTHAPGLRIGTVLGITFGAFLIGVLLTGALWYIYSHTRSTAKRPPVPADPPASESSSTNPSIGSTQSTPCSTSSMA